MSIVHPVVPVADDEESILHLHLVQNAVNNHRALIVDKDMISAAYTAEYGTVQNNVNLLTPPAGYHLCIREIFVRTEANVGMFSLDFPTSGKVVDRVYFSVQNKSETSGGHIIGSEGEPIQLNITGTGTNKVFLRINYVFHK